MKESKRNFAAVEEDLFKLHYEKWAEHVKLIGPVVITKKGEPQYVFMAPTSLQEPLSLLISSTVELVPLRLASFRAFLARSIAGTMRLR